MARKYYVVETEFGDVESRECETLQEAKKELKKIKKFYNDEYGGSPYNLIIVKHEEE